MARGKKGNSFALGNSADNIVNTCSHFRRVNESLENKSVLLREVIFIATICENSSSLFNKTPVESVNLKC